MEETYSFGEWVKGRRNDLRLTQRELAAAAYCSTAMIKKIEADERQPSAELAEALAAALQIPAEQHDLFVQSARRERLLEDFTRRLAETETAEEAAPFQASPLAFASARSPFVGRTAELDDITSRLSDSQCRLLTLLGPGGIGKTRLAIEAAQQLSEGFADGAAFVDLAAIDDPAYLPEGVAQALNLTFPGAAADHLPRLLQQRQMLILLDNCEQLAAAESDGLVWLSRLLSAAPGIKLLATSREQLQLVEEWVYPVPGLDAAGELFLNTAVRATPDFDGEREAAAITLICDLVDNLPLAVELAASWTPLMSCREIAERITTDVDILATTVRNIPSRHRSMRAVFEYSWGLLSAPEQEALMRLAVFRGGWMAAEAEAVAGADLLMLRGLVEKSLVQASKKSRFNLHDLIRQFAAEKLAASKVEETTQRQHYEAFLALAAKLDVQQHGPQGLAALRRYEQERENFQAAVGWSLYVQETDLTLRLLAHFWYYWFERGQNSEGERWTRAAIEQAGDEDSVLLCMGLIYLADYVALQGRFDEAANLHPRAVQMADRLGAPEARIMVLIGYIQSSAQVARALAYLQEMIGMIEETGRLTYLLPRFTDLYGRWLQSGGRYDEAARQYQKSLKLYREMGNVTAIAIPLGDLGQLALLAGDLEEAYGYTREGVTKARAAGIASSAGVPILANFGLIQFYRGEIEAAEGSLEEALRMAEELDLPLRNQQILSSMSEVAVAQGEVKRAVNYLRKSLQILSGFIQRMQEMGHMQAQPQALFFDVIGLCRRAALVAAAQGQSERAVTLASIAESLDSKDGQTTNHPLEDRAREVLRQLRGELTVDRFHEAWQKGEALPLDEALQFLLQER